MIKWHLTTLKIKDLKPHPSNPRILTKQAAQHLQESLDQFGLIDKPIINLDNTIIGGHQRIALLKKQKIKELECWQPDRLLDDTEVNELMVRLNRNQGAWDYDKLANEFDVSDLSAWGFADSDFVGHDLPAYDETHIPNTTQDISEEIDIAISRATISGPNDDMIKIAPQLVKMLTCYPNSQLKLV